MQAQRLWSGYFNSLRSSCFTKTSMIDVTVAEIVEKNATGTATEIVTGVTVTEIVEKNATGTATAIVTDVIEYVTKSAPETVSVPEIVPVAVITAAPEEPAIHDVKRERLQQVSLALQAHRVTCRSFQRIGTQRGRSYQLLRHSTKVVPHSLPTKSGCSTTQASTHWRVSSWTKQAAGTWKKAMRRSRSSATQALTTSRRRHL